MSDMSNNKQIDIDNLTAAECKLFNTVAHEIRNEFNQLIKDASRKHSRNVDWLISSIPSRNPYLSPLFERCCKIAFIKELRTQNQEVCEIILSDPVLAATLRGADFLENVQITCQNNCHSFRNVFTTLRSFLVLCFTLFSRIWGRNPDAALRMPTDKPITLLDVFVFEGKKGPGRIDAGRYQDRYYPGLLDCLTAEEHQRVYYLPGFSGFKNLPRAFRLAREARDQFIVPDDFLKISDYLALLLHPFRVVKFSLGPARFRGVDVSGLLRAEKWQTCCNLSSTLALLNYKFALRITQSGVKVRYLLEWYENQVNDRGMILGFRSFQPETLIVGYQGFMVSEIPNIHINPTPFEAEVMVTPHKVAVVGKGLADIPRKFHPTQEVTVAPAFRFQKLWEPVEHHPEPASFTILVGLPISKKESCDILRLVLDVFAGSTDKDAKVWIKPHPANTPEDLRSSCGKKIPDSLEFKTGDMHEHILRADLLISNGSSVCLESLAMGTPVIVVGNRKGFTQNPIPEKTEKQMWRLCYSEEELSNAVKYYRSRSPEEKQSFIRAGQNIKANFFEPLTPEGARHLLGL